VRSHGVAARRPVADAEYFLDGFHNLLIISLFVAFGWIVLRYSVGRLLPPSDR
jgi:hypothetical protein